MTAWQQVNHLNSCNFFFVDIQKLMPVVKQSRAGLQFSYQLRVTKQSKALSSAHTPADNIIENPQRLHRVIKKSLCT
jgi:hypothetical protein